MKVNLSVIVEAVFITFFVCVQFASAQSGGTYQITQTVTATGNVISGGSYSMENTAGQPLAGGSVQASPYSLYMGFWTPSNFTPTAATVSISGRVTAFSGLGIRNAVLTLTDSNGMTQTARTAAFGYYFFTDVRAGETYLLTISSKRFVFSNPTRVLNVLDELTDVNFVAEEQ